MRSRFLATVVVAFGLVMAGAVETGLHQRTGSPSLLHKIFALPSAGRQ